MKAYVRNIGGLFFVYVETPSGVYAQLNSPGGYQYSIERIKILGYTLIVNPHEMRTN